MIAPHLFHVIAGFILAALLVVTGFAFGPDAGTEEVEPISSGALAAYLFGAMMIVLSSYHADAAMIGFALLVAGVLCVAWRTPAAASALGAAWFVIVAVFAEWAVRGNSEWLVVPGGPMPGIGGPAPTDGSVSLHLVTAAIFAIGFGVTGFLAQGRFSAAAITVRWAAAAVFTPLALLVALYARIAHLDRSIPFAILAVLLAAAFGAATEMLTRREERPGQRMGVALFATGRLGALGLALTFSLEKGWLSIALALMSMGTAWISVRRPIPFMRTLAAILAAIVTARIAYEPRIAGDAIGTTPIFNWLLWGYGIPAASFWRAATSCAAMPTMRRSARWIRPRSCSRCCWRSWKSVMPSMAATSIVTIPASPRSRCRSAWRSPWRSAWSACASARAASFTISARCCSRRVQASPPCAACCCRNRR